MKRLMLVLLVLFVLALCASGTVFVWATKSVERPVSPGSARSVMFEVPKGVSARGLGPMLLGQGLIDDARLWRFYLWKRGGLSPKAGRHELGPGMSMPQMAAALELNPIPEDVPFTVVEGWRLRDTDAALSEKGLIHPGAYVTEASHPEHFHAPFPLEGRTLEGYLYPETYRIVPGALQVKDLIQRQLDLFAQRFYEPDQKNLVGCGHTLGEIVTMASMLEREEPDPAQRPLVAGILWKRLATGNPLGVDATSRYLLPEWNDRLGFLVRLRDTQDPWNSRVHKGLPPGPIGAPTLSSLEAALGPEKSDFWYYLHDAEHHLHPSRNAAEHEALRKKYDVY